VPGGRADAGALSGCRAPRALDEEVGRIAGPEQPANFTWGDEDRRTLNITARTSVYRMRLGIAGAGG
jgi:hypothetical protein